MISLFWPISSYSGPTSLNVTSTYPPYQGDKIHRLFCIRSFCCRCCEKVARVEQRIIDLLFLASYLHCYIPPFLLQCLSFLLRPSFPITFSPCPSPQEADLPPASSSTSTYTCNGEWVMIYEATVALLYHLGGLKWSNSIYDQNTYCNLSLVSKAFLSYGGCTITSLSLSLSAILFYSH